MTAHLDDANVAGPAGAVGGWVVLVLCEAHA